MEIHPLQILTISLALQTLSDRRIELDKRVRAIKKAMSHTVLVSPGWQHYETNQNPPEHRETHKRY